MVNCQQTTNELKHLKTEQFLIFMLIIGKAITNMLAKEEAPNETQCFPGWANNSKYNKNIINLSGLFIIGMIYCIGLAFGFSSRFDFVVFPQGILYVFVHCCCVPVLLPTVYFMRNPKHLISVLRDHNLFSFYFRTRK